MAYSPLELSTIYSTVGDEYARLRGQKRAWNAYYGHYGDSLNSRPGQPNDNIKLNVCATVVDYGAAFLFGKDLKFTIEGSSQENFSEVPQPQDDQTLWLSKLWRKNQQQVLLTKLAINGAVCGHAFIKIIPADPFPRLVVLDPSTVSVAYDPEDYGVIKGYRIQYNSYDDKAHRPTVSRQLITPDPNGLSWHIIDQVSNVDGTGIYSQDSNLVNGTWKTVGETEWLFSWPPVLDCQNLPAPNQYYGKPDLTDDVIHVAHAINSVISNRNRVVRLKGHPMTWARGINAEQIDWSPDATLIMKGEKGELKNLEMMSDMTPTKQLYDDLMEAFYTQTHIPPIALGHVSSATNVSGLELEIMYGPLIERTEYKRRLYGYMLEELNARLIEMQFGPQFKNLSTVVHWPPVLPVDKLAQGQALQIDQTFGASSDTILTQRGYDAQLELSKRKQEVKDGVAPAIGGQASLARGEGLPGDMRTPANQAKQADTIARRRADRAKSDGPPN